MWGGKDVLDFGGNIGNILQDPHSRIDEERYWCIDVIEEAIAQGKESYPLAHWLFYDRYNIAFNANGIPDLRIPEIVQRFDYIVAYSVFTSTTKHDMVDLIQQLRGLLKNDGSLAFTFIDPHYRSWPGQYDGDNLKWRLERQRSFGADIDVSRLAGRARQARWCMLVNDDELYINNDDVRHHDRGEEKSCHVFYTVDYMESLFPDACIRAPVNGEMQHCCILGKDGGTRHDAGEYTS